MFPYSCVAHPLTSPLTPPHPTHTQRFYHDGAVPAAALVIMAEAAEATADAGNVDETCMATLEVLLLGQECLALAPAAARAVNALKCVGLAGWLVGAVVVNVWGNACRLFGVGLLASSFYHTPPGFHTHSLLGPAPASKRFTWEGSSTSAGPWSSRRRSSS